MPKRMYGVELDVADGKMPGFYAQVVHKIGEAVRVLDRDQQLLIVASEEEQQTLLNILQARQMAGDPFELWLLPDSAANIDNITDYGFVSLSGHTYLFAHLVSFFRFAPQVGAAEDRWAATQQMNEYIITSWQKSGTERVYAAERNLRELLDGIARAYQVQLEWLPD